MYARRVGERTLTLHVSGMLWGDSVVLADKETGSEWSHILGRAMAGPLRGSELEVIPSVMLTWRRWKQDHPTTTVSALSRSASEYTAGFYRESRKFVLGLRHRGQVVAYPLPMLIRRTVIADKVADDPIIAVYDGAGATATAYRRTVRGEVLEFTADGRRMHAGGSTWSLASGEALDGPWKGQRVERLPAMISFAEVWRAYFPESRYGKDE